MHFFNLVIRRSDIAKKIIIMKKIYCKERFQKCILISNFQWNGIMTNKKVQLNNNLIELIK